MTSYLKVLFVDATTGFYRLKRYPVGAFFGPVDLGLHLAAHYNTLNFGGGLLSGSIFPGTSRMIFTGFSPCWGTFYISSMGGAARVFDNLGLNLVAIQGRAPVPSTLYLNRVHGEEIDLEVAPLEIGRVWREGRGGVYSVMEHMLDRFGDRYSGDPRMLAVGPAAAATDAAGVASAPVSKGRVTFVDTWAGRGGFGSRMFQAHGLAGVVYGGTHVDEDFRDRKVADEWFQNRYQKKLAAKDFEATTKYRFDPKFDTGGTFGVNYAGVKGRIIAFNYRSIHWTEDERRDLHQRFIVDHYLKQFNEETIQTKSFRNCGEPCSAVCKKMNGEYKKDYEPYQTMGPLCGVFDQRAAERLNHHADRLGFDAISIGGVLAWLMDCLDQGLLAPKELGVSARPVFRPEGFHVETDSAHNASIGVELLDAIIEKKGLLDLSEGARKLARHLAREKGRAVVDSFVYNANARKGWMVPNQYWTPGVLSPMAIMGKYYMYYGQEFLPPRELGRKNAARMKQEIMLDNLGVCRFHRAWAEEMIPEIVESLYGFKERFHESIALTADRINSRNSSIFWESRRNYDFTRTFLERKRDVDGEASAELSEWIDRFRKEPKEASLEFWFETAKGIHESLHEF